MSSSDDLRLRMQAQIAATRAAAARDVAPGPEIARFDGAPTPVRDVRPVLPGSGGLSARMARERRRRRRSGGYRIPPAVGFVVRFVALVVVAAAVAIGLRTYVVQPFWIPSQSMEPTLHGCPNCNDDHLLVDKLSYRLHAVHRGDVVVFHRPPGAPTNDTTLVKRVIGLPGETISARGGRMYIGTRPLIEPYVEPSCGGTTAFGPLLVPPGDVFVMGDNRCDSTDSRVFGPIPTSSIIGRAFIIVWPLARIHWL